MFPAKAHADSGAEIRLFDPERSPKDWTDVIRPDQCAVFLRHQESSIPLSISGRPFAEADAGTCIVFDRIDHAQSFCETKVREFPHLCCEIFDKEGRAHPPLLVITHPDRAHQEDAGPVWSRRRKWIAAALVAAAGGLLLFNLRGENTLATLLAFNCIALAMRFLFWDFGVKHRVNNARVRLEAHRMSARNRNVLLVAK